MSIEIHQRKHEKKKRMIYDGRFVTKTQLCWQNQPTTVVNYSNPPKRAYSSHTDVVGFSIKCLLIAWLQSVNHNTCYRSGTVNSNTVNSKFHLIRSYCEIFFYHFPNISCLKYTVNSNFRLIWRQTLPTNDFELTVPDLYCKQRW